MSTFKAEQLIEKFGSFLPTWVANENLFLTQDEEALGRILLMALGTLYVSLMLSETPVLKLSTEIMVKTNATFAPLMLSILNNIPLVSLMEDTYGRQDVLDSLYDFLFIKFEMVLTDKS